MAAHADKFAANAPRLLSRETLVQRSYRLPPHPHLAIGRAAEPVRAQYLVHEILSAYTIGRLRGNSSGNLVEFREFLSADGTEVATPEAARKALARSVEGGEERVRRSILAAFTRFGLVDVATDYGVILLAFTTAGQKTIEAREAGAALVGTEDAVVFDWRQISGGALEFQGRKTARRPLSGSIWIRRTDCAPLRISARLEHSDNGRAIRDEASVEYALSPVGFVTPATVVHRHFVDGVALTENLYTYERFRLFKTDTRIEYQTPATPR